MKKMCTLYCTYILLSISTLAQNVGVGIASPVERLDVNGNLNLRGNLKLNGSSGQPGNVLITNSSGTTSWANVGSSGECGYKNFVSFVSPDTWTVPAGVTKIMVEAWGAGGGGNTYSGGGGAGYTAAVFDVKINNTVTLVNFGVGGAGTTTGNAGGGTSTTLEILDSLGTTYTLSASGGGGASTSGTYTTPGFGGNSTINPGYWRRIGVQGMAGYPNRYEYQEKTAGNFIEIVYGGNGGDAGNANQNGAVGLLWCLPAETHFQQMVFEEAAAGVPVVPQLLMEETEDPDMPSSGIKPCFNLIHH